MQMLICTIVSLMNGMGFDMTEEQKTQLIKIVAKLHDRYELSKIVESDYFEPGKMEYLAQTDGIFDEQSGELVLRFEVKGTRYEGRTERIEKIKLGDEVKVTRDEKNQFNRNNFLLLTKKGADLGCMPAELCDVIAPLYDENNIVFEKTEVSFVEPISKRSRHAKQAVLFVKLQAKIIG